MRESIHFYLQGGDDSTDTQSVSVIERPYLKRIVAHYDYPDYAGLPNRDMEGGQVFGLEGTRVRMTFESSMPLRNGAIHFDGKASKPLPLISPTTFEESLILTADGSYSVELFEKNGFREARPERYDVRVTPYNPPEVELLAPAQNVICTPQAAIPVSFRATDSFRLRKVEVLYQIGDAVPAPLSDRITGPLDPQGKTVESRFTWDLRKMELPPTGEIQYFVRAQDVNPTGRGVTESPRFQIKLVKPSEFQFDAFEQAKRIEAEARLAWENQYGAWKAASQFGQTPTSKEDDPAWQELKEKQEAAVRAATAMETALRELIQRYEQNDMAREFMAGRLAVITGLLHRVNAKEHPAIVSALDQARPRTDADAGRVKELRSSAVARCLDNQKLAVLCLQRLLERLFDWRDLQTTLIRDTLLAEEQGEVAALTEQIAPKTLGWQMEDLSNDVQDKLLTLGKRQRTLFDVEGELEKELEFQIYRAERQQRRSILDPLRTAYRSLRQTRVNDNLKLAAGKIENNQAFQIIQNQKAALQILKIVKGGLIQAGQKIDSETEITAAMTPSEIIEVQPKPKTDEVAATSPAATEPAETTAVSPEDLLGNLNLGGDPVTAAINAVWEAHDAVLARSRYLSQNRANSEMPRFVKLKLGILLGKQEVALHAIDQAIQEAQKAGAPPVREMLEGIREELQQSNTLIGAGQLSAVTQQIQADSLQSLDDLRRGFLPLQKSVREAADENKRGGGSDSFQLKFLIRDKDLDEAVAVIDDLNQFDLWERDVVRKLDRFAKSPAGDPLAVSVEKINRSRASAAQRRAVALLNSVHQNQAAFSGRVAIAVGGTGLTALAELKLTTAEAIDAAAPNVALRNSLNDAAEESVRVARGLKDLLGEREKTVVVASTQPAVQPKAITLADWQKLKSPEALRAQLKADTQLPPEVRDIMLRSLNRDFPPRYRDLLAAYYASFVSEEKKQ